MNSGSAVGQFIKHNNYCHLMSNDKYVMSSDIDATDAGTYANDNNLSLVFNPWTMGGIDD